MNEGLPVTNDIFFWTRNGAHGFLSNFFRAPITVDEVEYPTTEHCYQAMKTLIPAEREMVRKLSTPKEAKFAGYHVALRENWDDIKEEYMLKCLRAKFTQHDVLKSKLLETQDAILHEDSPWDKYWGYAKGAGKDRLGVLLMQVREELKHE